MRCRSTRTAARARLLGAVVLLAAVSRHPAPLAAQSPAAYEVGAHVGSLSHSLLGLVAGTLWNVGPFGLYVEADVEAEPSTLVGGRLARDLSPSVRVRLRVAHASTHLRLVALTQLIPENEVTPYTFDGLGEVSVWLADVDFSWAPWRIAHVTPYLFGGLGLTIWDISGLEDLTYLPPLLDRPVALNPINARLPGAVVGIGVALGALGPASIEVEVSDHASGDPIADDDFRIGAEFAGHGRAKDLVHNLSLTVGLRIALRR